MDDVATLIAHWRTQTEDPGEMTPDERSQLEYDIRRERAEDAAS